LEDIRAYVAGIAASFPDPYIQAVNGGILNDCKELPESLDKALSRVSLLFYKAPGELFESSDENFSPLSPEEEKKLTDQLRKYPLQGRFDDFLKGPFRLWSLKQQIPPHHLQAVIMSLYLDWVGGANTLTEQLVLPFAQMEAASVNELIENAIEFLCSSEQARELLRWELRCALRYISQSYGQNLILADVASHAGLSPNYLNYLFQKNFNITITDYILNFRMERAKEYLRTTNWKVYEVAKKVGIPNYRYFSTLFKEQIGITPKEYQKNGGSAGPAC
jgi:two-component system response regulator YesN